LYRETRAIWRKTLGNGHAYVPDVMNELASVLEREGKTSEAEKLRTEAAGLSALQAKARQP
jgi:hypothetical protein